MGAASQPALQQIAMMRTAITSVFLWFQEIATEDQSVVDYYISKLVSQILQVFESL